MKNDTEIEYKMPKRVTVEKAGNGFIVRSSDQSGEKNLLAHTMAEAHGHVATMMGEKEIGSSQKNENFAAVKAKAMKRAMKK